MAFTSETVRIFLSVLDHGSFSAAARALGRVPSAVSMAIAGLEAELDLALFDRAGREPVPTAAARALEPEARAIARGLGRLEAHALSLHAGLERRLCLAVASDLLAIGTGTGRSRRSQPTIRRSRSRWSRGRRTRCWAGSRPGRPISRCSSSARRSTTARPSRRRARSVLVAVAAPSHPLVSAAAPAADGRPARPPPDRRRRAGADRPAPAARAGGLAGRQPSRGAAAGRGGARLGLRAGGPRRAADRGRGAGRGCRWQG